MLHRTIPNIPFWRERPDVARLEIEAQREHTKQQTRLETLARARRARDVAEADLEAARGYDAVEEALGRARAARDAVLTVEQEIAASASTFNREDARRVIQAAQRENAEAIMAGRAKVFPNVMRLVAELLERANELAAYGNLERAHFAYALDPLGEPVHGILSHMPEGRRRAYPEIPTHILQDLALWMTRCAEREHQNAA